MKLSKLFNRFRLGKTQNEKETILKKYLTKIYWENDRKTGQINIFPCLRASDDILRWKKANTFDYYYDLFLLNKKHNIACKKLASKYKFAV